MTIQKNHRNLLSIFDLMNDLVDTTRQHDLTKMFGKAHQAFLFRNYEGMTEVRGKIIEEFSFAHGLTTSEKRQILKELAEAVEICRQDNEPGSFYDNPVSQSEINSLAYRLDATGACLLRSLHAAYMSCDRQEFDIQEASLSQHPSNARAGEVLNEIIEKMTVEMIYINIIKSQIQAIA